MQRARYIGSPARLRKSRRGFLVIDEFFREKRNAGLAHLAAGVLFRCCCWTLVEDESVPAAKETRSATTGTKILMRKLASGML